MQVNTQNFSCQIQEYCSGIMALSGKSGLPLINYASVAKVLGISRQRLVSSLQNSTPFSASVCRAFQEKYADEVKSWPKQQKFLGKVVRVADVLRFFNLYFPYVQTRALFKRCETPAAPIAISYRGHQSIKDGMGMVFDHMRLQKITGQRTLALLPEDEKVASKVNDFFQEALKTHSVELPVPLEVDLSEQGLLVIPGRARVLEHEKVREGHELKIIKQALNRGQPILGLCAGSWRVLEALREWTDCPNQEDCTLEVKDHCNAKMLGLQARGTAATYNIQLHDIKVTEGSLLQKMMWSKHFRDTSLHVNSVHWKAINENVLPPNTAVSAKAAKNPQFDGKNRQGNVIESETGTVEAIETLFGSPIICTQWHPEAYGSSHPSGRLITAMAQAGDAYAVKRKILAEFQTHYKPLDYSD